MRLSRLRLDQFRQFRRPFELRFAPGLNLIHGPNESGKSTLARAIRAAFFERHRSNSVDDLCPWGDSSAAPSVALDFVWQDREWRLSKSFLKKKRCDLQVGSQHFEGEEAEDRLAALLGFQFPGRGASKEEHWGIPGLLWVEQGRGQDLHEAVGHAGAQLKSALDGLLGEVVSSGGDELLREVKAQRDLWLTGGGKPKGELAELERKQAELQKELTDLDGKVQHYRSQVDRLGMLREQQRRDEAERPWDALQREYASAERRYREVDAWQDEQQRERQALETCRQTLALLRQQRQAQEDAQAQRARRQQELEAKEQGLAEVQSRSAALDAALDAARAEHGGARERWQQALRAAEGQRLRDELGRADEHVLRLRQALDKAQACQREWQEAHEASRQSAVDPAALQELKRVQQSLTRLQGRSETSATRLRYALEDGRSLELDGRALRGQGEELLLNDSTLRLPGFGTLQISPGGDDLGQLRRDLQRHSQERERLLKALQVASLEEAEVRLQRRQAAEQDLRRLRELLASLAPEGLASLQAAHDTQLARLEALRQACRELPDSGDSLPLAEAESLEAAAEVRLQHAEKAQREQQQALALALQARDSAQREWQQLQLEAADPRRQQQQDLLARQILEGVDREALLQAALEERQRRIDAAQPQLLQQDMQRLGRSLEQLQNTQHQRQLDIAALQGALESAGTQGLEEQRDQVGEELQRSARRHQELQRRAQALDLLLELLQAKRQALTQRLQAPLQKHLQHYLALLFPGAHLEVDERLMPSRLSRPGQEGLESGELRQFSFGAREQLGLISRLAYADLLREAGRPTLILLDDSLVHSDKTRLAQMQRVLYDAAQRHQILLFSCHPENWLGLGAVSQDLVGLKTAVELELSG